MPKYAARPWMAAFDDYLLTGLAVLLKFDIAEYRDSQQLDIYCLFPLMSEITAC